MNNSVVQNNKEVFNRVAEKYLEEYFRNDERYMLEHFFRGKKVLLLGCGAGRLISPILDRGFVLTGIDIAPRMVVLARESIARRGLKAVIHEMDACHLQFPDNSFDTVFFPFHGIGYVHPDIYTAVREARRVMRPDGVFIFSAHNRFSLKEWQKLFAGSYARYGDLINYRATPLDYFRLRRLFKKVHMIQRSSIERGWRETGWEGRFYKLFPLLNKTTYFVCLGKGS